MTSLFVVMACRNESENIKDVLTSLRQQTMKPTRVVIIDDASTDNTFEMASQVAESNWIVLKREKNNERYSSIVNTMKMATTLLNDNFEYLMILDGDTILEPAYVEKIIEKFEQIPKLGLAGGNLILKSSNKEIATSDTTLVFGSNRIYSKKCWFDINEGKNMKVNSFAWDSEHSIRAQNKGYHVRRFNDIISYSVRVPSLKVPSFAKGILRYQFGNSFTRTLISAIINFDIAFLSGYIYAIINNKRKIDNKINMKKLKHHTDYEFLKSFRI